MRTSRPFNFVSAAFLILAPGAIAAEDGSPAIQIVDSQIRLTDRLNSSVPVVSHKLLQSLHAEESSVSKRALTFGRPIAIDHEQKDLLDLHSFSHLIDTTPGSTLERAIGKEWIVTLAGTTLYMEKRTDKDVVFRVAVSELWERLLAGDSQEILKSPSLNYDQAQDRWTLTGAYDRAEGSALRSMVVSAVSESGDPTGSWRVYRVNPKDDLLSVNPVLSLTGKGAPVLNVSWMRRDEVVDPAVPEPTAYPLVASGPESGLVRAVVPQPSSISPSSGTGMSSNFNAYFTDLDGASTITFAGIVINSSLNGMNSCVLYYDGAGRIGLVNDANNSTTWATPGNSSSPAISNSQCTLRPGNSYIYISGTSLQLGLDLTFNPNFGGVKALYMYAKDASGDSQWQVKGYWTVPTVAPAPVPRNFSSGSGYSKTFDIYYDIVSGGSSITFAGLLINRGVNGTGGCVVYFAGGNKLGLLNDSNTNVTYITVGTSEVTSNSQCTLRGSGATISTTSTYLFIRFDLTFAPTFAGVKDVFGYARTSSMESGWRLIGSWGVPSTIPPPHPRSIVPSSGAGDNQQFSLSYENPSVAPLAVAGLLINSSLNGVNSCLVYFDVGNNRIGLVNDANTITDYIAPQTTATVSNSQCSLNGIGSAFARDIFGQYQVSFSLSFKPGFRGTKSTYAYGSDTTGQSTGWIAVGFWTVIGGSIAPRPDQVSPSSGAGAAQTFGAYFTSPSGASTVTTAGFLVNPTLNGVNNCVVYYSGGNQLCLANNPNTSSSCVTAGVNTDVSNSQCMLRGANSSVLVSGTTLRIFPSLQFFPAFNGVKNTYSYACVGSLCSGWQLMGTWTVE